MCRFRRDMTVDEGDPTSVPLRSRRVAAGFAVRLWRHRFDLVLALFHPGQGLREALVLDDRRVRDPLFLVEEAIRQKPPDCEEKRDPRERAPAQRCNPSLPQLPD